MFELKQDPCDWWTLLVYANGIPIGRVTTELGQGWRFQSMDGDRGGGMFDTSKEAATHLLAAMCGVEYEDYEEIE